MTTHDPLIILSQVSLSLSFYIHLSIYITWLFPPVWGVADNTKETTKTMGVSLSSSSNDEGLSRVWTALLEQHSPSSPSSTTYVGSWMPTPLLPLPQVCLYKATLWQQQMPIRTASQSFATIPIPSTLTCLPKIHPPYHSGLSLLHPSIQTYASL